MGKLTFGINMSIDGCVDHTRGMADEEVHRYFTQLIREADVLLYGRKTYELMVPYWPEFARNHAGPTNASFEFAQAFNSVERIVVCSQTLKQPKGNKTSIINSNLKDEVLRLKQEQGTIMTGGVELPCQLIQWGLVDELHLVVQPIIVGAGRRLADDTPLPCNLPFRLAESTIFKSGCISMRYVNA